MSLEGRTFTLTHGAHKRHKNWVERKSYDWASLCQLLTDHEQGAKDGPCFTPAIFQSGARKKDEAEQIDILVLDCDTGEPLEQIIGSLQRQGWAAIIASTHSHMGDITEISRKDFEESGLTPEAYLKDKKGLQPGIAKNVTIQKTLKTKIVLQHPPCPKFRVIIPLLHPWKAADYETQDEANRDWKRRVEAAARILGLKHDQSCTDTSRMYYLPRHAENAPYVTKILDGIPCDLNALEIEDNKDLNLKSGTKRKDNKPHVFFDPETGKHINLVKWVRQYGGSFKIADILRRKKPEKVLSYGSAEKTHIICVNNDQHTQNSPDDTACFVSNSKDSPGGSFVYCCLHSHCKNEDRLYFIKRMLEQGWLAIEDLYEEDDPPLSYNEIMEVIEPLARDSEPSKISDVLLQIKRGSFSAIERENLFKAIKAKTALSLKTLRQEESRMETGDDQSAVSDLPFIVMQKTLGRHFHDGAHLIRAMDKSFWHYNGKHWRMIGDEQIESYILSTVEIMNPDGAGYRGLVKAAFDLMVAHQAAQKDYLHSNSIMPPVINTQSGELWLDKSGKPELRKHAPQSFLKNVLDISYDPHATCPRFDQAMLDIFAASSDPPNMVRHVEEIMGYIIQPGRFHASWFMWVGRGSNGKTRLFQTLERLMGKSSIYADRIASLSGSRFALGHLNGKLLFGDDDVATGTVLDDGLLKKLSEGKLITGEMKFKGSFEFYSQAAILLLANNYPFTTDLSHGMLRRAQIVPFDRIFTEEDRDDALFPYIWEHELPGILNRLLNALERLITRGHFLEPLDCRKAKQEWLRQANPLVAFLDEQCKINAGSYVPLKNLYEAFQKWCQESGIHRIQTKQTVHKNLKNLGFVSSVGDGYSRIQGLELLGSWFGPAQQ